MSNEIPLRKVIQNEKDLAALRESLRASLTLEQVVGLFKHTIKKESLGDSVARAVGQKARDSIKQSAADKLAADMLGFHNTNEMFAHYQVQYFNVSLFRHHREYDDASVNVVREQGVEVGVLDMLYMYPDIFHYKFEKELHAFEYEAEIKKDLRSDEVEGYRYFFDATSPLTGAAFNLSSVPDLLDRIPSYFSFTRKTKDLPELMSHLVVQAGVGVNFEGMGDPLAVNFGEGDCKVIGIDHDASDPRETLKSLSDVMMKAHPELFEKDLNETVMETLISRAGFNKKGNAAAFYEPYDLYYDHYNASVIITRLGVPYVGAGLYLDASDIRCKAHYESCKRKD